jgi:hypothetical protein
VETLGQSLGSKQDFGLFVCMEFRAWEKERAHREQERGVALFDLLNGGCKPIESAELVFYTATGLQKSRHRSSDDYGHSRGSSRLALQVG